MLEKPDAERAVNHVNCAIEQMLFSLAALETINPSPSYDKIKRIIGISIGNLDIALCEDIFSIYPDLDPVKTESRVSHIPRRKPDQ